MPNPKRGKVIKARLIKLQIKDDGESDKPEHRAWREATNANTKRIREESPSEAATKDDELMRLWGEISSAWDDIEYFLGLAFDAMLSDEWRLTHAVFYSQRSHAARRDMVQDLAKQYFITDEEGLRPLKNAIARIKARGDARHSLTHGTWGWLHKGELGMPLPTLEVVRMAINPDTTEPSRKYTKADLKNELNSMRDTWRALAEAALPLMRKKAEKMTDHYERERYSRIEQRIIRKIDRMTST